MYIVNGMVEVIKYFLKLIKIMFAIPLMLILSGLQSLFYELSKACQYFDEALVKIVQK